MIFETRKSDVVTNKGTGLSFNSVASALKINSIEGKSVQKTYTGKNLLPNDGKTKTESGVTFTVNEDKSVTINGTATEQVTFVIKGLMTMSKGSYIFAKDYKAWNINCGVDQNKNGAWEKVAATHGSVFEVTDENVDRTFTFYFRIANGAKVNNVTVYPLLRKSNTDDTYEPYVGGVASPNPVYPQNINSSNVQTIKVTGKNQLKNIGTTITTQGITFTVNEDKSVTANGTATGSAYFTVGQITLKPNQSYNFSSGVSWNTNTQCYLTGVDGKSDWLGPRVFTPITNKTITCQIYIASGTTVNNLTFKPMIRPESITNGTYVPYQGESSFTLSAPVTLRSVGNVKDVICKQGNVWGVLRRVGVYTPTGNETYSLSGTGNFAWLSGSSVPIHSTNKDGYSSHFTMATSGQLTNAQVDNGFYYANSINFRIKGLTTADAYKNYFKNNSVSFYYVLATPVFEALPDADQKLFNSLKTYDGVTVITTGSTVEPEVCVTNAVSLTGAYALDSINALGGCYFKREGDKFYIGYDDGTSVAEMEV